MADSSNADGIEGVYTESLRREARPLESFEDLNKSQGEAFEGMIRCLTSAHENCQEKWDESDQYPIYIYPKNPNPIAFVAGERGTGKTSLLLSLHKAFHKPSNFFEASIQKAKKDSDGQSEDTETGSKKELQRFRKLERSVQVLRNQVIWLPHLDLEPLPGPTNLLGAIMSRLELAVEKQLKPTSSSDEDNRYREEGPPWPLDEDHRTQRSLDALRRLQQDTVLAWEAVPALRGARIDPDTFATEILRAERARAKLHDGFKKVLRNLARALARRDQGMPIFVLPIDDFDINPARSLELIRLLRMVSSPHLFALVLGNIKVAEQVFALQVTGDLTSLSGRPTNENMFPFAEHDFTALVSSIAGETARKMIPPGQRFELGPLETQEALDYKPHPDAPCIGKLLREFKVEWLPLGMKEKISLYDFINLRVGNTDEESWNRYGPAELLRIPQRHVHDLWVLLNQRNGQADKDPQKVGKGSADVTKLFRDWLKVVIEEEPFLSPLEKRDIGNAVTEAMDGHLDLHTENLRVTSWPGPKGELRLDHCKLIYHQTINYRFHHHRVVTEQGTEHKLRDSTAAIVMLLHDVLVLQQRRGIIGQRLVPDPTKRRWVSAEWTLENGRVVIMPWLAPPTSNFRMLSRFRERWAKQCHELRKPGGGQATGEGLEFQLLQAWLQYFSMALVDELGEDLPKHLEGKEKEFGAIRDDVLCLLQGLNQRFEPNQHLGVLLRYSGLTARHRDLMARWWIHAICTMTPECGFLDLVQDTASSKDDGEGTGPNTEGAAAEHGAKETNDPCIVKDFVDVALELEPGIVHRVREIRTRRALQFLEEGDLALALCLFSPNALGVKGGNELDAIAKALKIEDFGQEAQKRYKKLLEASQLNPVNQWPGQEGDAGHPMCPDAGALTREWERLEEQRRLDVLRGVAESSAKEPGGSQEP